VLPRPLATLLGAAVLAAAAILGASFATPAGVAALGPLPACRYDDILTAPSGYDDWSITLVDTILDVPATYVPPDLVPVSDAGIAGTGRIRSVAVADLRAMAAAAKKAGTPIGVQSAYRSFETQARTFQAYVDQDGYQEALLYSARPGHSEHQLGLAIDFKSAGGSAPWTGGDWGKSPAGTWMRKHAWQYGWILSYPKGQLATTCYTYEPWHFRYVGRALAAAIHAAGLTTREYLWANFTTAVVPSPGSPAPSGSAQPSLEPSPSAGPGASPGSPSPSPAASSSTAPSDAPSPPPSPADTPTSPLGFGLDAASAAAVGLVLGLAALSVTLALWRRRRPT
jgi:D-alanyl-D-alanine carboxypeptidase